MAHSKVDLVHTRPGSTPFRVSGKFFRRFSLPNSSKPCRFIKISLRYLLEYRLEWLWSIGFAETPKSRPRICRQAFQRLAVRRARHAAFRDDPGDVAVRRYVERGIEHRHAVGRHHRVAYVRYFARGALLDGDVVAAGERQVERGDGRGHVKRHAVFFGQHGQRIRADFVGDIAVRGDAVGTHYDHADLAFAQYGAGHVVGDQCYRNAVFVQLPRGETRALQHGTRFATED